MIDGQDIPITKGDLFMILDAMNDQWSKHKVKNIEYIMAVNSIKIGMHLQSEKAMARIINDMVRAINALQQMGAFKQLEQDEKMDGRISFFRDKLIEEIKSGEFFKGYE